MSIDRRVEFLQDRLAYMIGFGLPVTFITSFGPQMVKMAIFALLYPIVRDHVLLLQVSRRSLTSREQFVIQAIQSRPPSAKPSLLPSTPSPTATPSPSGLSKEDPFFTSSTPARDFARARWDLSKMEFRIPIFVFARYAIEGLRWLEAAVLRDRAGGALGGDVRRWQERAGKRMG